MDFKDYYAIMGVSRDATQDDIKRAYRKLARKFHPDVSRESGAEDKFKALGEAYEVLRDPEKRAAYDQLGSGWREGQDFRPPPGWDAGFEFSGGGFTSSAPGGFSEFFETLFGGLGGARAGGFEAGSSLRGRGQDHHSTVKVALEDAMQGATLSLQLRVPAYDTDGRLVNRDRHLKVKVPRGVTSGKRIRLPGQGGAGINGGAAGDLFLEVRIKPHAIYQVDGKHVLLNLPVTPWEAALGGKVQVPTPSGRVDLAIPEGAASGQKLRLKGRGIPVPGEPAGDLFVVLQITTPPADSPERRALYESMAREMPFDPRRHLGV